MGELILNKKDSLRKRAVSKPNILQPHSTTKNISSGPRRKLFIVNSDGEGDDDVSSQDMNEEQDTTEIEHAMFDNVQNENETGEDDLGCQVNGADREQRGLEDEDDEYTDEMMYEHIPNGTEEDDSDHDLENENGELVREQQQAPQAEKIRAICNLKKRGPTMMHGVHVQGVEAREINI